MHEPLLGRAANPAAAIVLGLPLKAYSLGHELLLWQAGNPLVEHDSASGQHLAEAAWICSNTWRENTQPDPFGRFKIWLWRRRIRKMPLEPNLEAFARYRKNGSLELPLSNTADPNEKSGRVPGSPWVLLLQQFIQAKLGISEEAAWDYNFGLAKMRWAAYWEVEGGLRVYNIHDHQHDEEYNKWLEQEAKKGELQCQAS